MNFFTQLEQAIKKHEQRIKEIRAELEALDKKLINSRQIKETNLLIKDDSSSLTEKKSL